MKSEVGSRKSEVGSRKSEVGSRKSEVGSRKSLLGFRRFESFSSMLLPCRRGGGGTCNHTLAYSYLKAVSSR